MSVHRTLRFQLIALVILTVTSMSVVSYSVGMHFIGHALEEDLEERAEVVLATVAYLWETGDPRALQVQLNAVRKTRRQVTAIDVFEFHESAQRVATTRDQPASTDALLRASAVRRLKRKEAVKTTLPEVEGVLPWRLAVPLEKDGIVVGAAQVEVWPIALGELARRLRRIDALVLVTSIALISVLLLWYLERGIARPIAALRKAMDQAERGDLQARAAIRAGGELGTLADGLNKMLAEIEALTGGLQTRVEEATQGLAQKNRELQQLNEKLRETKLEAARRQPLAAAGQMVATIAHELGTPLNSMLGYTQLLLGQEMSPSGREKLIIIESQVRRMIESIQSVLNRTRMQQLPRAPVTVPPVVEEALAFLSQRIADAGLSVRTEIPSDLPRVPGDAVGLREILINLLTNAIDATGRNGTISVQATVVPPTDRMGGRLELAVGDTGEGLSGDELKRIFEPFYTTKEPGLGTGLGLAIVKQIVSDHGGQVLAESEAGRGTTIRVQLPLEP